MASGIGSAWTQQAGIALVGARIWIEAGVDFRDPVHLVTAAVALIVGTANYTLNWGDYSFAGIALGDSLSTPLAGSPDPRGTPRSG